MISDIEKDPAVHDNVLVEAELDGEVVGFRAVVVNVQRSALWLGLVRPDSTLGRLVPGQNVHLTFKRDQAAIVADSAFQSHLGSNRARLFAVARPSHLDMVQRRAHIRLDVERLVQIRVVNHGVSGSAGRMGTGMTRNVSAGGVQFVTDLDVAVGDSLELAIVLGTNDVVAAEADAVRVDDLAAIETDPKPRRLTGSHGIAQIAVAVRFTAISEVDQDKIVRHIFSVQRQRRDEAAKKPS